MHICPSPLSVSLKQRSANFIYEVRSACMPEKERTEKRDKDRGCTWPDGPPLQHQTATNLQQPGNCMVRPAINLPRTLNHEGDNGQLLEDGSSSRPTYVITKVRQNAACHKKCGQQNYHHKLGKKLSL